MNKIQLMKITLLIVILAEEIKKVVDKNRLHKQNELLYISSCLITDFNNNDASNLIEYSARLNSHVNDTC